MRQQQQSLLGCFVKRRMTMNDKAKLALVGAVAAVIFASPALAQTINGGDETGNASSYSYQPAAADAAVRHAGARAARRNGLHAYAMARHHARRTTLDAARAAAIHDCNIEADKYNPITQLPNQFAVYGTCMAEHGQRFE
jgi:hypothetical protein